MKVLNEGNAQIGAWWVGKEVCCSNCQRRVVLEKEDYMHPQFCEQSNVEVRVHCENCHCEMVLKKD